MSAGARATDGVALDIGAGFGALVVYMPRERLGEELEVVRVEDGSRTHVAVLERRSRAGVFPAAVFGSLPAGRYRVGTRGPTVVVADSQITEMHA